MAAALQGAATSGTPPSHSAGLPCLTAPEFSIFDKFPKHFGTTIKSSFYDDISLYQASPDVWNGNDRRCWTDGYNAEFKKKFAMSPVEFYPAMWYDIGPSTAAARSMLFGLRAELLSVSFVKRVADWCAAHKIDASGHPAGDYEVSPMGFSGDALKFYQHPQRPLLDVIGAYGDKRDGYKLSGSAAFIYDKPILQCETYGAFEGWKEANFTPDLLYRTAMELYARGINLIIPHGVWYAHPNVPTPPEISWRNPIVAASLPAYNTWAARCQLILQGGRHVADIAVLYPITAIYADCYFRNEGTDPEYLNVGERLTHSTIPPFHHSLIASLPHLNQPDQGPDRCRGCGLYVESARLLHATRQLPLLQSGVAGIGSIQPSRMKPSPLPAFPRRPSVSALWPWSPPPAPTCQLRSAWSPAKPRLTETRSLGDGSIDGEQRKLLVMHAKLLQADRGKTHFR